MSGLEFSQMEHQAASLDDWKDGVTWAGAMGTLHRQSPQSTLGITLCFCCVLMLSLIPSLIPISLFLNSLLYSPAHSLNPCSLPHSLSTVYTPLSLPPSSAHHLHSIRHTWMSGAWWGIPESDDTSVKMLVQSADRRLPSLYWFGWYSCPLEWREGEKTSTAPPDIWK